MNHNAEALDKIRHSLSHILAWAVRVHFKEQPIRLGIGPTTEEGFYYDFETEKPISNSDLKSLESLMRKLVAKNLPFERSSMTISHAIEYFTQQDALLKVELIEDLRERGETEVSIYTVGDFLDLCAGPHVENTKEIPIKGFSLDRVAGAYWRGNEKNQMLSRVYGLAFPSHEALEAYRKQREDAEKYDHRKIGKEQDLFVISKEVGKGLPLLTAKGATIRRVLERYIVDEELERGYQHVNTPVLGRKSLYVTSGHWEHYKDSIYPPLDIDGEEFILRPMTCPHHFMLFDSKPHSYRDLPIRYAEVSPMYRRERSGELSGLVRVMGFHLFDAHLFVTPEQVEKEIKDVVVLIQDVIKRLGLADQVWYRLSLRDDTKEKYIDMPTRWQEAEAILRKVADELALNYVEGVGHAAFYGPKLDIQMRTIGGKEETLFTNQIDFASAERFDLKYMASDNTTARPIIIHRSSAGCIERTIAFLLEHYRGALPTWLAPVQVALLPVNDRNNAYAEEIHQLLRKHKLRIEVDCRKESLNQKIRQARLQRIPYLVVIGDKEQEGRTVTVRNRDSGIQQSMPCETFVERLTAENENGTLMLEIARSE
ncbi:MAG: threonine--tRNA ligase [Magnetococcales bacterium]|nr:threonine--tRNA ligase [Magnetococcales bacterium]